MEERVQEIIAEILRLDREALMAGYDDREIWESMQRVEVLFAIEDEFDISFSEEELAELNTPAKLTRAVLRAAE